MESFQMHKKKLNLLTKAFQKGPKKLVQILQQILELLIKTAKKEQKKNKRKTPLSILKNLA